MNSGFQISDRRFSFFDRLVARLFGARFGLKVTEGRDVEVEFINFDFREGGDHRQQDISMAELIRRVLDKHLRRAAKEAADSK